MATPALETDQAERKIVADIRAVLRKVAASRPLSAATQPANLARLTDKAFRQEFPAAKPANRLAAAIARAIPARRKLTEDEGGSLSAAQAAQALGISKQVILPKGPAHRLARGTAKCRKVPRLIFPKRQREAPSPWTLLR